MTDHDPHPAGEVLRRPDRTYAHWIDVQEIAPALWQVAYQRRTPAGPEVLQITRERTEREGWAALDDLDFIMIGAGYIRSGIWEPGIVHPGYVAWVEPWHVH